jgi:hypothetical protein
VGSPDSGTSRHSGWKEQTLKSLNVCALQVPLLRDIRELLGLKDVLVCVVCVVRYLEGLTGKVFQ